jgi:hypothetical protein
MGVAMVKEKCYYAEGRERCGGDGGLWWGKMIFLLFLGFRDFLVIISNIVTIL